MNAVIRGLTDEESAMTIVQKDDVRGTSVSVEPGIDGAWLTVRVRFATEADASEVGAKISHLILAASGIKS